MNPLIFGSQNSMQLLLLLKFVLFCGHYWLRGAGCGVRWSRRRLQSVFFFLSLSPTQFFGVGQPLQAVEREFPSLGVRVSHQTYSHSECRTFFALSITTHPKLEIRRHVADLALKFVNKFVHFEIMSKRNS
jgi:hypothetical protein